MNSFKSPVTSSPRPSFGRLSQAANVEDSLNIFDENYFGALYEFAQGSSPKVIWKSGKEPDNFMDFIVNTPAPSTCGLNYSSPNESHLTNLLDLGDEIANVVSSFGEYNYIALYSQVLDCQARGFTRTIVLAITRTSPTIIKYIEDSYYDQLTSIINKIYKESYDLFVTDISGYALSLAKTINVSQSPQLISKMEELKPILPFFGVDIEKSLEEQKREEESGIVENESAHISEVSSFSSSYSSSLQSNPHSSSTTRNLPPFLNSRGEVKDPMFFITIDNNLRPLEQIINFQEKIYSELTDLMDNLPITETTSAIMAQIDIDFTNLNEFDFESSESSNQIELNEIKKKTNGEIDLKKKTKKRQKKLEKQYKKLEKRIYGLSYDFDFNFGDFKGQYSQLVTNILHFDYDKADFKLYTFLPSNVFHHCAYSILSGKTLVILSSNDWSAQSLADRLSLLSPFYISQDNHKKKKKNSIKNPLFDSNIQSDLTVNVIQSDFDDEEFDDTSENNGLICAKNSISLHDCFKYAIVVTNEIIYESSLLGSINVSSSCPAHLSHSNDNRSKTKVRNSCTIPPNPNLFENDENCLNILDLKTMNYYGEECPKSSFLMEEFTPEVKKYPSLSATSSTNYIAQLEQGTGIPLNSNIPNSSSPLLTTSSSFQTISKNQVNSSLSTLSSSPMKTEVASSPLSPDSENENITPSNTRHSRVRIGNSSSSRLPAYSKGSILVENGPEIPINNDSFLYPNENQFDTSEISESESAYMRREMEYGISSFSGIRHKTRSMSRGRRFINPSDLSDASANSGYSQGTAEESTDSENVFVLNMYAIINRKATQFVKTLLRITLENKPVSEEKIPDILKKNHLSPDDEPIYKYWLLCFFNKQKCRPVWNVKPPSDYKTIPLV